MSLGVDRHSTHLEAEPAAPAPAAPAPAPEPARPALPAPFAELGLIRWDPEGETLELLRLPTEEELAAARDETSAY